MTDMTIGGILDDRIRAAQARALSRGVATAAAPDYTERSLEPRRLSKVA